VTTSDRRAPRARTAAAPSDRTRTRARTGTRTRTRVRAGALAILAALATVVAAGCAAPGTTDRKDPGTSTAPATRRAAFVGVYSPENGSTVGTAMIVSLRFSRPVADRAAVERAVTVTSVPPRTVVGHWFGDRRLDLRPEDFWPAGAHVTLSLRLRGVRGAPGVYGTQAKDVRFTVARDQRSTVDAAAHTMTVVRDGHVLRVLPITAGSAEHTTYNGVMVISQKFRTVRMDGATVGFKDSDGKGEYDIPDVPHAMRLTTSGTFVHGNYWSPPEVFGSANLSHGCVGLPDVKGAGDPDTPAAWFYANSLVGDAVRVVGSDDRVVAADNGMSGWNLSWRQWTAGSALAGSAPAGPATAAAPAPAPDAT
jgi:lipoprotein-anchoring transpeptidase ErfK/SrfK